MLNEATMSNRSTEMGNAPHAALIRRELRSETNQRFLRAMPPFRTESALPERLMDLLNQLDRSHRDET